MANRVLCLNWLLTTWICLSWWTPLEYLDRNHSQAKLCFWKVFSLRKGTKHSWFFTIWCAQQLIPMDCFIHSRFSRASLQFSLSDYSSTPFSRIVPLSYLSFDLQKWWLRLPKKSEKPPKLFIILHRCCQLRNIQGGKRGRMRVILLGGTTISWSSNSFPCNLH
jgi:hypothetical protein